MSPETAELIRDAEKELLWFSMWLDFIMKAGSVMIALTILSCIKYLFLEKPQKIDTSKLDRIEEKIIQAARKEARDEIIRQKH